MVQGFNLGRIKVLHVERPYCRYIEVQKALSVFNRTFGNGYIVMSYAVAINEYLNYDLALLVFVGTLKFLKLLRFNERLG